MNLSKLLFYTLSIIVSALLLASTTYGQAKKISKLKIRTDEDSLVSYLTDGEGRSLYIFLNDSTGQSTCFEECSDAWPPALLQKGELTVGKEIDLTMVGTIKRSEKTLQNHGEINKLTYNIWYIYLTWMI